MSKYKVVITDREYESIEAEKSLLEANDCEVFDYQYKDQENILRVAKDADAIIVQYAKMPKELIEQLDKCKIIARYAIRASMCAMLRITAMKRLQRMRWHCCWNSHAESLNMTRGHTMGTGMRCRASSTASKSR